MGLEPRYRHWIEPASEGKWPTDIVCVDCTSEVTPDGNSGTRQTEVLLSWHAVALNGSNGGYCKVAELAGHSADAFLDGIARRSIGSNNLWVVSYQCTRVWSLLRVWEGIEDGEIVVTGTDHRASESYQERVRRYRRQLSNPLRTLNREEIARLSGETVGYLVTEDPPNILRGRFCRKGQSITWIDVRNHGIDSLGDTPHGMDTVNWLARWIVNVCKLCRANGLTAIKATAGSQAMSAWRHSYLGERVHVHTDDGATGLESDGYCGGRCEATRIGVIQNPVWHIDFRSQYGSVCADEHLPTRLCHYSAGHGGRTTVAPHNPACCIAEVTVETDEPAYPVKRDGMVIYPIGRYRTVLCGPELSDASVLGRIRAVHAVAVYEMGRPLKAYAETLYRLRCKAEGDGNPGIAAWIKRLIVNLPGKMGQKNHRWLDCPHIMPQCMYGEWFGEDEHGQSVRYRSVAGLVQRDWVGGFSANAVPAIAAFVCSHARLRLLNAIRAAAWCNVYYYDTDSLMVNREGYERLQESEWMLHDGMGQLTLRSQPQYLEIRGVKYYVEDRKVTCAGLARGDHTDIGDGQHYARYLTASEQGRAGVRPAAALVHGTYIRAEPYRQGTVQADGSVKPFVLNEQGGEAC